MIAGYDAFQSKKRWVVTVLSFMLASASVVGIMVYIDSFSMAEWNERTSVGPSTMIVSGYHADSYAYEISQISGVEKAAPLTGAYARVASIYKNLLFKSDFFVVDLTPSFIEAYPTIFNLTAGRFPSSNYEIALDVTIIDVLNVNIGDSINYTYEASEEPDEVIVVGVFNHPEINNAYAWHYKRGGGVVTSSRLSQSEFQTGMVYVKVDSTFPNPSDPRGSYNRLYQVQEEIRHLDAGYEGPGDISRFVVQDFLGEGISGYIEYLDSLRASEMVRGGGVILLAILAGLLVIRFNVNDRKTETNIMLARGASHTQIDRLIVTEILAQSLCAVPLGIILGISISRIALASIGFFVFDFMSSLSQPFIFSIDALIVGAVVGITIPFLSLISLRVVYKAKSTSEEDTGRLAKVTRGLSMLRWDAFLMIIGTLILLALLQAGEILSSFPILIMVIQLVPYAIFAGFASIATKGLKRGADILAKLFARLVGKIPSWVGIRRIAKESSSAGPSVMVLVLAMSIAWTSAIVDASLPNTNLNQSRFAISGDASFQLDESHYEDWSSFSALVNDSNNTESSTLVSVVPMHLSLGGSGDAKFCGINPNEFKYVGYDYLGKPLDESEMSDMLDELSNQETGAIISSNLAKEYSLLQNDVLRAFLINGSSYVTFEFQIIGIVEAIPDTLVSIGEYSYSSVRANTYYVGSDRVLINRQVIETYIDVLPSIDHFLCVRTPTPEQSSQLIEEVMNNTQNNAVLEHQYVSVMSELEEYVQQDVYILDRGIDTMLAVLTIVAIAGTFTVYAIEGLKSRSREIALLRAMGADDSLVAKSQASEMIVLAFTSMLLLGLYAPLLIINTLLSSLETYGFSPYSFPVKWFVIIPWPMLIILLIFFMTCFAIFIAAIAVLGTRISLSSELNASWTETGFMGGEG